MARKKISTGVDTPPAVIDLDEDDEIVKTVTTETRVGRQKRRTTPESVPSAVADGDFEPEPDDEDAIEAEFVEDVPQYPDNSIAAFLYGDDSLSEMTSEACTVYIRRKADTMGDNFRKPNPTESKLPKLHIGNILETTKEDIEDRVRKESGSGGHYFFQIFRNGRLGKSWESTLSDPFTAAAFDPVAAPMQSAANAAPPTSPTALDPLDNLLAGAEKFAKLKEVFGGGSDVEKVRLEFQIAELRREIEAAKAAPQERKSERLTLLETALAATSPDLQTKILNNLFPNEDPKDRHWFADVLDVALSHKEELLAIGGPLIMSLLGAGQQQPPNVAQLLQAQQVPQPPPPLVPQPTPEPERPYSAIFDEPAESADPEPNTETDETAIEVVEENEEKPNGEI